MSSRGVGRAVLGLSFFQSVICITLDSDSLQPQGLRGSYPSVLQCNINPNASQPITNTLNWVYRKQTGAPKQSRIIQNHSLPAAG